MPLGQRISIERISVSCPNPKWTRLSLDDMNPTLMATWLYRVRPEAVVSSAFAPIASRALLWPVRARTIQWLPLSALLWRARATDRRRQGP
jgi:hypothetical protein